MLSKEGETMRLLPWAPEAPGPLRLLGWSPVEHGLFSAEHFCLQEMLLQRAEAEMGTGSWEEEQPSVPRAQD